MALADDAGTYEAAALALLLEAPRPASVPPPLITAPGCPARRGRPPLECLRNLGGRGRGAGLVGGGPMSATSLPCSARSISPRRAPTRRLAGPGRRAAAQLRRLPAGPAEEELAARATAATARRLREAGFPFAASIEQFDFRFRPDLKRQVCYATWTQLRRAGRHLDLIGPPGLGKTMLAICVATKQIQLGYTARS